MIDKCLRRSWCDNDNALGQNKDDGSRQISCEKPIATQLRTPIEARKRKKSAAADDAHRSGASGWLKPNSAESIYGKSCAPQQSLNVKVASIHHVASYGKQKTEDEKGCGNKGDA